MQKQTIAMMVAAGCVISVLTGCGVPQEEHNAMIAEIEGKAKVDQDALSSKVADLESLLQSEKNKIRTARIDLDDAAERIKNLQDKSVSTSKALSAEQEKTMKLESELSSAKSASMVAQDQAIEAESKFNALDLEYQALKNRFEMFQKNMSSMGGTASSAAPAEAVAPVETAAPEAAATSSADSETALSILDSMGNM